MASQHPPKNRFNSNNVTTRFFAIFIATASALIASVRGADAFKPDSQGYIRNWLMLAPIILPEGRPGTDLIFQEQIQDEGKLQPKAGEKTKVSGKEVTWIAITASTNFVDLNASLKSVNDHAIG